jgi:hypothetical protein
MSHVAVDLGVSWQHMFVPFDTSMSIWGSRLLANSHDIADERKTSILLGGKMRELYEQLVALRVECLRDDWDGYGAKALNLASFDRALRFLYCLPTTTRTPEVAVEPDGEIAFEWANNNNSRLLSVSVAANGELNYAGLYGVNKVHGTEHFDENLPSPIMDLIHRVYR